MLRLYKKYFSIHLKSVMQYKVSFFITLIGNFITSFTVFLGVVFMFQRFHRVKDFQFSEVVLCYGILLLGFQISQMFASGFKVFDTMIADGQFDRILTRPCNEIFQVLASRIDFVRLGGMFQGVVMFVYGISQAGVDWTPLRVLILIFSHLPFRRRLCLLHPGGPGVYECVQLWGLGAWQVSRQHLRQGDAHLLHLCGALCLVPILPPAVPFRPQRQPVVHVPAPYLLLVRCPLLAGVALRGTQV